MAAKGKDLSQQLEELISSLQEQGILTDYFDDIKELQDEINPRFVDEIITIFLRVAEDYRAELTRNLNACGLVSLACQELVDASEANNQEGCLVALENVNHEYLVAKENLNRIVGMECEIYDMRLCRKQPE
ncbi:histidine-containing phosphotransfer protein 3-like [Prunus avium]|uniref:Histidine-containing phosphotransfer protein n=1 Tax=Prunus avium TaxID=42229 RepID=A0A6P5U0B4_PRUAV|nr:histidine-containing phosphotransfer protein 3-like [Prunus avium]